jgi:hypothetical protein
MPSFPASPTTTISTSNQKALVVSKAALFLFFHFQVFVILSFQAFFIIILLIAYFLQSSILSTILSVLSSIHLYEAFH